MFETFNPMRYTAPGKASRVAAILFSTCSLLLLCWLDYITGDYSLIVFYLIPVSLTTWFVGQWTGLLFCLFSLVARLAADYAAAPNAPQFSRLHLWNLLVEFLLLVVMSLFFGILRNTTRSGSPSDRPLKGEATTSLTAAELNDMPKDAPVPVQDKESCGKTNSTHRVVD